MKRFFLKKENKEINEIQSFPYIIEVINDTSEIKDVDIFGSAEYIPKVNDEGFYEKNGVRISNGVYGANYLHLLSAVWKESILTDNFYIILIEGDKKQLYQPITRNYTHPNGNKNEQTYCPYKDPYQQQDDITRIIEEISIDFLTKLSFQIMPKTHVRFTILYKNI